MVKKQITQKEAIKVVQAFAVVSDYGCETWEEVLDKSLQHVDGLAVALDIDDEYVVIY